MKQTVEEAARIEREKVIQELHVAYKMHKDPKHCIISSAAIQKYAVPLFKAGADWQAKQSPWISVEERLPENEDRVLVLCKMRRFNSYFTLLNNYIDGEWETKTLAYYDTIAWMPIPSFDEILKTNQL